MIVKYVSTIEASLRFKNFRREEHWTLLDISIRYVTPASLLRILRLCRVPLEESFRD